MAEGRRDEARCEQCGGYCEKVETRRSFVPIACEPRATTESGEGEGAVPTWTIYVCRDCGFHVAAGDREMRSCPNHGYGERPDSLDRIEVSPASALSSLKTQLAEAEKARDKYDEDRHSLDRTMGEYFKLWRQSEAQLSEIREALGEAADDLDKAANQFDGINPQGANGAIFAGKASRFRALSTSDSKEVA